MRSSSIKRILTALVILATALNACTQGPVPEKNLEIFSWWTTGNQAQGLSKLIALYAQQKAGVKVVNATQSGGNESIAPAVLASRIQGGDPPDSFQVKVGHALLDSWVLSGKIENLDDLYKSQGWETVIPKGLLDTVFYQGHYYAIPVSANRANMLWYNKTTFTALGITSIPQSFDDWFAMADKCKAAGLPALALGDSDGSGEPVYLFETILIGSLGAQGYLGLWSGTTSWTDAKVTTALENFKKMLGYLNPDYASLTWNQANQMVIDGKACTTILPDWVDADNQAKQFTASGWAPAPNNGGIYDVLADSFSLPKGAADPGNAKAWLELTGSLAGQEAVNPVKGSICSRTDCDPTLFGPYLQWSAQEWAKDTIVPSLAGGEAAGPSWTSAISDTIGTFMISQDSSATQTALVKACTDAKVCK